MLCLFIGDTVCDIFLDLCLHAIAIVAIVSILPGSVCLDAFIMSTVLLYASSALQFELSRIALTSSGGITMLLGRPTDGNLQHVQVFSQNTMCNNYVIR